MRVIRWWKGVLDKRWRGDSVDPVGEVFGSPLGNNTGCGPSLRAKWDVLDIVCMSMSIA